MLLPERRWSCSPSLVESAPGPSRRRIPSCPDSRTRGAASLFAFAANSDPSGVADIAQGPVVDAYIARAEKEYAALSPTPTDYKAFLEQIEKMWATQPNWTAEQLHAIAVPVWIVDADHDEAIKRENTEFMAKSIPGAGLLIQTEVSHFSFLQDPQQFTGDVLHFLEHAEAR